MTVTTDFDKMAQAIANEPDGPCTAVTPEYLASRRADHQVAALELTFRILPGATDDDLAARTSLLLRGLSQREAELGGEGLELDMHGSVFGPARLFLRLFPSKHAGATQRVAALVDELNAQGEQANERAGGNTPESLGVKINRNFKAAIPETAMKQLEAAVVA